MKRKGTESEAMAEQVAKSISEGKATVHFENEASVFYNPVQEFNRDLSVAAVSHFLSLNQKSFVAGKVTLLDALSASGLRSIRYAKEVEGIDKIIANDISKRAIEAIKHNLQANDVESVVTPSHSDASMKMYQHKKPEDRFTIVDLDPYGSPTAFLDAAVQSTADGGLLGITCTDMAVLCGNTPETCYSKYGALCLKSKSCHEQALRIALQCVESHANRYGRYIEPLLSVSADFYIRLFVRIQSGHAKCKKTTSKLGHVYQCCGCESFSILPLGRTMTSPDGKNPKYKLCTGPPVNSSCEFCGRGHHVGGPMWIAPIHDQDFVRGLLGWLESDAAAERFATQERMIGMLTVISEELPDVPLYYMQDRLCSLLHAESGKMVLFRSALLNAGFKVSLSHANRLALKTDATISDIWDMMRAWEKLHPVDRKKLADDSVASKILEQPAKRDFVFTLHPDANPPSRDRQLIRFQVNPMRNWGPKTRATANTFADSEKRVKNQGKRHKKCRISEEKE